MAVLFPYVHLESDITIIKDLFTSNYFRDTFFKNITVSEFLDTKTVIDSTGKEVSNRELIWNAYTKLQQSKIKSSGDITESSPININTKIYIPQENLVRDLLYTQTENVLPTKYYCFIADKLKSLMALPGYQKSYTLNGTSNRLRVQDVNFQVFLWSRNYDNIVKSTVTDGTKEDSILKGQWLNITPYVSSISTTVTETGGNFDIKLAPIICEKKADNSGFQFSEGTMEEHHGKFVSLSPIQSIQKGELVRNQIYFHNLISENDLIFIKYEALDFELGDRKQISEKGIEIPNSDLATRYENSTMTGNKEMITQERIYDMMGMVDSIPLNSSFSGNDITVSVKGRDFVKTIIDDGSFFFPMEFAGGMFLTAGQADKKNSKLYNRNLFDGKVQSLNIYFEKTIQQVVQFITTQLSNTGYVPTETFAGWGNKRNLKTIQNTVSAEKTHNEELTQLKNTINRYVIDLQESSKKYNIGLGKDESEGFISSIETLPNISQLQTLVIDFASYLLDNDMISNIDSFTKGSIGFNAWTNTFNSSTLSISEQANDIAKLTLPDQLPDSFVGVLYNRKQADLNFYEQDLINKALRLGVKYLQKKKAGVDKSTPPVSKDIMDGVWGIITTIIDPSVANLKLVDTSISETQGSLLTTLNKVCHKPFVEFFTDTYGDKFYFVIRKPPFDKDGVLSAIYGDKIVTEKSKNVTNSNPNTVDLDLSKKPEIPNANYNQTDPIAQTTLSIDSFKGFIIDIEEADIVNESLDYYTGEIYSWYRVEPQGLLWGSSDKMTWAFLPAIYFEEYSDIWGSRPYQVTTPYLPLKGDADANSTYQLNSILKMAFRDLKFIIDTTCYLPFTRQGSITLNKDRRIKRGCWIRHKGTNEVYYVDSVSHSTNVYPIANTTTISVSRGMVEKYLKPGQRVEGITEDISYFNIINTELDFEQKKSKTRSSSFVEKNPTTVTEKTEDLTPDKVLGKFKVNKEVFNFFHQKKQFFNFGK